MIPTTALLLLGIIFIVYAVFWIMGKYDKAVVPNPDAIKKANDLSLVRMGYAFDTLKLEFEACKFPWASVRNELPGYQEIKKFGAIIFTTDHGVYLSRRVSNIIQGANSVKLEIQFPEALVDTEIQYFIVYDENMEIISESNPAHKFPLALEKGDTLHITQTVSIGDQVEV